MTAHEQHKCARCGVADEDVVAYPDHNEHRPASGCELAALKRALAERDAEIDRLGFEVADLRAEQETVAVEYVAWMQANAPMLCNSQSFAAFRASDQYPKEE